MESLRKRKLVAVGYHAVPVIADAWMNGIRGFDPKHALEACVSSATNKNYGNLGDYIQYGYVPFEKSNVGSSMTLEYAYDDWTIAQLAKSHWQYGCGRSIQQTGRKLEKPV